mgnify:CR=1 FL=1
MTPGLRREAATWAITERDYSQRRACRLIGMDPKTWRYASHRPDDAAVRGRLAHPGEDADMAAAMRPEAYNRHSALYEAFMTILSDSRIPPNHAE